MDAATADPGRLTAQSPELDAGQAHELLTVVLEALDIPSPATVDDGEVHDKILNDRFLRAKITLRGIVGEEGRQDPDSVAWSILCLQAQDNRVAPEVCQSVSGRVRGSPKRVMTLVLKLVMAVMWSPAVVMTRRQ